MGPPKKHICDRCRKRKIKCDPTPQGCRQCTHKGVECREGDKTSPVEATPTSHSVLDCSSSTDGTRSDTAQGRRDAVTGQERPGSFRPSTERSSGAPTTPEKRQVNLASSTYASFTVHNLSESEHAFVVRQRDSRLQAEQLQRDHNLLQHSYAALVLEHGDSVKVQNDLDKTIETLYLENTLLRTKEEDQRNELTILRNDNDLAKVRIAALEDTIARQKQDLAEGGEELQEVTDSICELRCGMKDLQADKETLTSKVSLLHSKLNSLQSEHDQLTSDASKLTLEIEKRNSDKVHLQQNVETLQENLATATLHASESSTALAAAQTKPEEAEDLGKRLREELQAYEHTVQMLKDEKQGHLATIRNGQDDAQRLHKENDQLRDDLRAADNNIATLNKYLRDPRLRIETSLVGKIDVGSNMSGQAELSKAADSTPRSRPKLVFPAFEPLLNREKHFADWFEVGDITFEAERAPDNGEELRSLLTKSSPSIVRVEAFSHHHWYDHPLSEPDMSDIDGRAIESNIKYQHLTTRLAPRHIVSSTTDTAQHAAARSAPRHQAERPTTPALQKHEPETQRSVPAPLRPDKSHAPTQSTSHNKRKRSRTGSRDDDRRRARAICRRCLERRTHCSSYGRCTTCYIDDLQCSYELCQSGLDCRSTRCPRLHPGQWDDYDQSSWGQWSEA